VVLAVVGPLEHLEEVARRVVMMMWPCSTLSSQRMKFHLMVTFGGRYGQRFIISVMNWEIYAILALCHTCPKLMKFVKNVIHECVYEIWVFRYVSLTVP
jgi:hypothetical protein